MKVNFSKHWKVKRAVFPSIGKDSERAEVDTKTNHIVGNQPITGVGPAGNLLASSFEMIDNGAHMIFNRGAEPVRLHIDRAKKQ